MYVPLWCKSNYSFLEGASHPDELVDAAHALGLPAIALTDRDGVYGVVRAWARARDLGVHLVYGAQLTLDDASPPIVLLACDREGYRNLCRLLTTGRLRCEKGSSQVSLDEVCAHAPGLIALSTHGFGPLSDAFGDRLYALVARHHLDHEPAAEAALRDRARKHGVPLVAAVEVLYHTPSRRRLQDVLTCIRHGTTLDDAGQKLRPNDLFALPTPDDFAARFVDLPDAVARTREIAARCTFDLGALRYVYPAERLPDGKTSMDWLRELAFEGARRRYETGRYDAATDAELPDDVFEQLERELGVIDRLDYPGYFLTMFEIVRYCGEHGILCQGRGSAANSVVCYSLGITAVDPLQMGLLFERFLSEERAEPPDIDLDISHERREEVIQHVYQRYGRDRAAMVANVIRYRGKSALRDVGKVLGFPETELDRLAKSASGYRGAMSAEELAEAGFDPTQDRGALLAELTAEIIETPRHLSIHPGGFLLGHEPVHDLVPIENGTMADRTVIQWDKYDIEELGLFKVDLLGLGALTHLSKSFELLRGHRGVELSMATIPPDDQETYEMVSRAETIGVFQIESRAQMAMLPRMRPRRFYDLVIEVGIIRPGPITGDMVHPYLRRRNGEEEVTYPHPSLKPVLEKTLGIPLFQEQVMKLAVLAADYTPGEADGLRRDMAAWRSRGRIDKHRERMIRRMIERGIEPEFAERVFAQIQGFGEYGFPESHAASFALITYATSYLKCHHPVEFACGLLNSQPMGFYTPATIIDDAKRAGVVFLPVDALRSDWDCTLEPHGPDDFAIRMGLRFVKGMREEAGRRLLDARRDDPHAPPFTGLPDLARRSGLDRRTLRTLAEAGAFQGFGLSRREALWQVQGIVQDRNSPTLSLPFEADDAESPDFAELGAFEAIAWDYRTTFHSPRGHPLQTIRDELTKRRLPMAREIRELRDGRRVHFAGVVICRQRPSTASGVIFITLEDETGFANLVVWPKVYEQYRLLARTQLFLGVTGRVQNEQSVVHIVVERLWIPDVDLTAANPSRDFR